MHFTAFRYAFIVALGGFVFGLDAAIISGTVGFVGTEFNLSDLQVGTVVSAPGFGVLFALLTVGYLSERLGRKRLLQWIAFFYLVSAIWSAFAPSYEQLIAARFLGGLAFTSLSLAAMYIGEIAPAHMRGKLVAMNQINIVVGLSAAYFINYFILQASSSGTEWVKAIGLDTNTWRWMLGSEILPAAVWFGLLFFIPRSPRWLVLIGRDEEASMVLAKLSTPEMVHGQLLSIKQSIASSGSSRSVVEQFRKLMSPTMRNILLIGVTFAIVQQITGINAILFYAPTIFEQLGIGTNAAFMNAVFVGLVSLVATACALLFIDTLGRRPMTILGLSVAAISLSICAYGFHSASYTLTETTLSALPEAIKIERIGHLVDQEFQSDVSFKEALRSTLGEEVVRDYGSDLMAAAAKLPATLILIGILCFIAAFQFSVGPISGSGSGIGSGSESPELPQPQKNGTLNNRNIAAINLTFIID